MDFTCIVDDTKKSFDMTKFLRLKEGEGLFNSKNRKKGFQKTMTTYHISRKQIEYLPYVRLLTQTNPYDTVLKFKAAINAVHTLSEIIKCVDLLLIDPKDIEKYRSVLFSRLSNMFKDNFFCESMLLSFKTIELNSKILICLNTPRAFCTILKDEPNKVWIHFHNGNSKYFIIQQSVSQKEIKAWKFYWSGDGRYIFLSKKEISEKDDLNKENVIVCIDCSVGEDILFNLDLLKEISIVYCKETVLYFSRLIGKLKSFILINESDELDEKLFENETSSSFIIDDQRKSKLIETYTIKLWFSDNQISLSQKFKTLIDCSK